MAEAVERPHHGGAALREDEVHCGYRLATRPVTPDLEKLASGSLSIGVHPSTSDFEDQTFKMSSTGADLSKDLGTNADLFRPYFQKKVMARRKLGL